MSFFQKLVSIIKERKIIFRLLQGTRSHDLNQLQLFKPYENDPELNFRIIETAQEETINGFHILWLPEEYPENSNEYYAEFKTKEYNAIFGHGTFDFVAAPGQIELSLKNVHSAPVLIWKEWKDCVKNGFISFGHIHGRNVYKNKIYYSGSFTRWNFGEPSEKGFTIFDYDLNTLEYHVDFVNNTLAPQYTSFNVKQLADENKMMLEEMSVDFIKNIFDMTMTNEADHFRIDLSGLSNDKIEILKKYYNNKQNVKLEIREKPVLLKESKSLDEFKKWHYITKRQLPLNEMIKKYCKEELNTELTTEQIANILKTEA